MFSVTGYLTNCFSEVLMPYFTAEARCTKKPPTTPHQITTTQPTTTAATTATAAPTTAKPSGIAYCKKW